MKTTLPVGSFFRCRERGSYAYYEVSGPGKTPNQQKCYSGIQRKLKAGDIIHDCVWKGDSVLEVRNTRTLAVDPAYKPAYEIPPDGIERMDIMGLVARNVVVNGHPVSIFGDGGIGIRAGFASWSWISDKRNKDGLYEPVGPSAAELKKMTDQELINLAKEAIDKMHSQSKMSSLMLCGICQVPDVLDQSTIKFARKR